MNAAVENLRVGRVNEDRRSAVAYFDHAGTSYFIWFNPSTLTPGEWLHKKFESGKTGTVHAGTKRNKPLVDAVFAEIARRNLVANAFKEQEAEIERQAQAALLDAAEARVRDAAPKLLAALRPFAAMAKSYDDMIDTPEEIEFTILIGEGERAIVKITREDFIAAAAAVREAEDPS